MITGDRRGRRGDAPRDALRNKPRPRGQPRSGISPRPTANKFRTIGKVQPRSGHRSRSWKARGGLRPWPTPRTKSDMQARVLHHAPSRPAQERVLSLAKANLKRIHSFGQHKMVALTPCPATHRCVIESEPRAQAAHWGSRLQFLTERLRCRWNGLWL